MQIERHGEDLKTVKEQGNAVAIEKHRGRAVIVDSSQDGNEIASNRRFRPRGNCHRQVLSPANAQGSEQNGHKWQAPPPKLSE